VPRAALEVADIFRQHGPAYRAAQSLPLAQLRVMRAVEVCRTAVLGGHIEKCGHCDHTRQAYNSCRNRHCPKCQTLARARWLESRTAELLPVEYFHVVFTLPERIAEIAFYNKEVVYGILFGAASQTLLTIAADPKHLGAGIGFFGVLHTWGQNLLHHPHVHFVVPGGGISSDGTRWNPCRAGFFLPVRVLSRLFRRLFLEQLAKAFQHNQLHFPGAIEPLQAAPAFAACLASQASCEWVVYAKPPFGGPQQVLDYLGRYTHRVAISNQRLLSMEDGNVTFQWKDYRHSHKLNSKRMTLAAGEFIRRFLIHTLPSGFPRIRHFGFLANRHRKQKLKLCRELIRHPILDLLPPIANERQTRIEKVIPPCPHCKIGIMIRIGFLPPYQWPERPPDSS
jgi:Putative transposase/Transposase zinc-binding domain